MLCLYRRLFISFLVCGLAALVCWRLLSHWGFGVLWWVPLACFVVIAISNLAIRDREEVPEAQADPDGPIPFRPPTDDGGPEGISSADRERFG